MPKFGTKSKQRLETCHPDIKKLFYKVVQNYDCSVLEGARSIERQRMLFNTGKSKTMKSKHIPKDGYSRAIDIVPYPISWGEKEQKELLNAFKNKDVKHLNNKLTEYRNAITRFYHFAGYVKGVADEMGIKLRWGGDWDRDNDFSDQTFNDLPHFELFDV